MRKIMSKNFTLSTLLLFAFVTFLVSGCATGLFPQTSTVVDYVTPPFGIVIDKNLQVLSVDHFSAAEQAKTEAGDHLITLNGVTLISPKQARDVFQESNPNQPIKMSIVRNGKSLTLTAPAILPTSSPTGNAPIIVLLPSFPPRAISPTSTPVPPDSIYF